MGCEGIGQTLGCRVIGEVYNRTTHWGIELYVRDGQTERLYTRRLQLTDDPTALMAFCRRINVGMVSALHAGDVWRDFLASLVLADDVEAEHEIG